MDPRPLEHDLSAAPQAAPQDMPRVAAAGFRAVLSNRPDGEEPGQPTAAEMKAAAEAAGLAFAHVPVRGGAITDADVEAFRQALNALPKPVFGFCRTGARTTTLWALSKVGGRSADDLVNVAANAGYDLSGLRSRLDGGAS
jgi:uncharacterized protein (TIGR01244 family)